MNEFNYQLLEDRVAIKPDTIDTKNEIGLLRAPSSQVMSNKGTVIAVGTGLVARDTGKLIPMWVQVGQRVIMEPFGWEPFEELLVGRETSVKCIILDK